MRQPVPAKLAACHARTAACYSCTVCDAGTEVDNFADQSAFLLMQDKRVQGEFMQYKGRLCKTSTCFKVMQHLENKPQDADTD
jgi:hypothetical protein